MAASITINQPTGAGPGVTNVSRKDLWVGQSIELVANLASSYQWTLEYKPRTSTATLSGSTTQTATFTPDVSGSYRIKLLEGFEAKILTFRVVKDNTGAVADYGLYVPAFLEDLNETNYPTIGGTNTVGVTDVFEDFVDSVKLALTTGLTLVYGLSTQPVGTADPGVLSSVSRSDHVHAHGNQLGGSLHALADGTNAGFLSSAHFTILNNASASATANSVMLRDADGGSGVKRLDLEDTTVVGAPVGESWLYSTSGVVNAQTAAGTITINGGVISSAGASLNSLELYANNATKAALKLNNTTGELFGDTIRLRGSTTGTKGGFELTIANDGSGHAISALDSSLAAYSALSLQTSGVLTLSKGVTTAITAALEPTGASNITFAAGATSVALQQSADLSAAGATFTVSAQSGFTGFAGGKLDLRSGAGGTGAKGGDVTVSLRNTLTSASGQFIVQSDDMVLSALDHADSSNIRQIFGGTTLPATTKAYNAYAQSFAFSANATSTLGLSSSTFSLDSVSVVTIDDSAAPYSTLDMSAADGQGVRLIADPAGNLSGSGLTLFADSGVQTTIQTSSTLSIGNSLVILVGTAGGGTGGELSLSAGAAGTGFAAGPLNLNINTTDTLGARIGLNVGAPVGGVTDPIVYSSSSGEWYRVYQSAANTITRKYATGITSVLDYIDQATVGVGGSRSLLVGAGAAGSANGALTLGAPTTNTALGGGIVAQLGAAVGGVTDRFTIKTDTTEILRIYSPAANYTRIGETTGSSANLQIFTSASLDFTAGTTLTVTAPTSITQRSASHTFFSGAATFPMTWTPAAAGVLSFGDALTSVSVLQNQHTSGAGSSFSLRAQRGFTGFNGGDLILGGGDPGTSGTNLAGNTRVILGTAGTGGVTGHLKLQSTSGTDLIDIYQNAVGQNTVSFTGVANLGSTSNFNIVTTSNTVLSGATNSVVGTTRIYLNTPEVNFYNGSSRLIVAPGAVTTVTFDAAVTAVSIGQAQHASAAGNPWSMRGQQGAAGFIGGDVTFSAGKGGTPGTNKAGTLKLDAGQAVSNVSALIRLAADTQTLLDISQSAASTTGLATPSSWALSLLQNTTARIGFDTAGNNTVRTASGGFMNLLWQTASAAAKVDMQHSRAVLSTTALQDVFIFTPSANGLLFVLFFWAANIGTSSSSVDNGAGARAGVFHYNSGTLTQIGSDADFIAPQGTLISAADMDTSGTNIRCRVNNAKTCNVESYVWTFWIGF